MTSQQQATWREQDVRASEPSVREENLQRHYKALNPCLAAAVLHARPADKRPSPQMAMSHSDGARDAEME